jgi:hypothetical protein
MKMGAIATRIGQCFKRIHKIYKLDVDVNNPVISDVDPAEAATC